MLVVQKYGGTSVGSVDRIEAVADRIAETIQDGNQCVVVVSAMGHSTDELVSLAHQIDKRPEPREMDALLATGEQVSAALVAMALMHRGIKAQSFTGWQAGMVTEPVHGAARVLRIETEALEKALDEGVTPVVTGFQGISDSAITTLGRGGSDTSAVAIAASLDADACEIYTDVTGVFTTDPRVVPTAHKLSQISYDEMLELANLGAQVLHPRAVESAKQFSVPLVVKSSFVQEEGTWVVANKEGMEERDVVTGIAFEREVARVALIGVPLHRHGLASVFGQLADASVNVDVIVQSVVEQSRVDVSFTVKEDDVEHALELVNGLKDDLEYTGVVCENNLAKVSIVGAGMISNPGVAATMFRILAENSIPVKMVSTSEIKVSCIVPADSVEQAVQSLHSGFLDK